MIPKRIGTEAKQNHTESSIIDINLTKMLGCFNPRLGKIWTNPTVVFKM